MFKEAKAIIFDLDGVIVNSEPLWLRETELFLERRNLKFDQERLGPLCTGRSLLDGAQILQEWYKFPGDPQMLADERLSIARDLFLTGVPFMEGFTDFFDKIVRDRYQTCVATSMNPALLKITEDQLRLSSLFQNHIYTIADVNYASKPKPDIFLYAGRKLEVAPEECIVIEDAPNGVAAAKAAGMTCLALTTTYRADQLQQADYIAAGFRDLAHLF